MNNNYSENMNIFAEMGGTPAVSVCRTLCDKRMTADISGEFTLPDYLPEMRRLVRVTVTPTTPSKFISGNSVQIGGGVDYGVCYVGADGKLYGTTFPGEYSFNAAFDPDAEYDVHRGITADVDVRAETVVGRVMGARRLSLKSRLSANVVALGGYDERLNEWASEPLHAHTQRLTKKVETCRRLIGSNDEIVIRDRLDTAAEGARLVNADCGVFLEEVKSGDGYVDCRGTVKVKYLLCRESDGAPYTAERRYPLSETVPLEGMRDGSACTAFCVCTGVDSSSDGMEGGDTECTVHLRLLAQGFVSEWVDYVSDAYSTLYDTDCELKELRLPVVAACGLKNMTYDTSVTLEKLGIPTSKTNISIISATADASVGEWEYHGEDGRASVSGTVGFNVIYSASDGEGESEISSAEVELPFKMEGFDAACDGALSLCAATAFDPRVKQSGGEIALGCEIALSSAAVSEISVENVASVNIRGEATEKRSGISLCFPGESDTLWSVSKKYRVLADRVRRDNRLAPSPAADSPVSLEKVKYLIV